MRDYRTTHADVRASYEPPDPVMPHENAFKKAHIDDSDPDWVLVSVVALLVPSGGYSMIRYVWTWERQ